MQQQQRRTYLVTGGAGFIGSFLCERLVAEGHDVVCVDNFFTGSKDNLRQLSDDPSFELLRHDITVPLYVEVDGIFNLAGPASPLHDQFDPVQATRTNVHGAINVLGLARRLKVPILQASTSEVYGDPLVHPQVEGYWGNVNPIGPRACYGEGKRCAETLFFAYRRQHDVPTKIARIFNTYGPRMHHDDGRVVANFVVQALCGKPLTVFGDGRQTRSFCYVDDLVEGLVRLMATTDDYAGPVNLGNPGELTVLELAAMVLELTGSRSTIAFRPLPHDDPRQRRPEISEASHVLRWQPMVPLAAGLKPTIDYFDDLLRRLQQPQVVLFQPRPRARPCDRDREWWPGAANLGAAEDGASYLHPDDANH